MSLHEYGAKSMTFRDEDITPAVLLRHMQGMEQRLGAKIESLRSELKGDIWRVETSLGKRMDGLEKKVDLISVQIANIDERLDVIEVVQLPMIKKHIGLEV